MPSTQAGHGAFRTYLHRHGIVRTLNTSFPPSGPGDALIQVVGPRWFANRAAVWAVRTDPNRLSPPAWDSVRVIEAKRFGRWTRRVRVEWRRP